MTAVFVLTVLIVTIHLICTVRAIGAVAPGSYWDHCRYKRYNPQIRQVFVSNLRVVWIERIGLNAPVMAQRPFDTIVTKSGIVLRT